MTSYAIRRPTEAEHPSFFASMAAGFGEVASPEGPLDGPLLEADRHWAAFHEPDSGEPRLVGTTTAHTFSLTVPGSTEVPVGGLAGVTVQAPHRRRGLLRKMLDAHLDECVERGEVASVLTASETGIYDRFGYGWTVEHEALRVSTARGRFRNDLAEGAWTNHEIRMLYLDEMVSVLPAIYNRVQPGRSGTLSRTPEWWGPVLSETEGWKGGGALFCAVASALEGDQAGTDVGYVLYVLDEVSTDNHFAYTLRIKELVATNPDVEAALWRHCLDRDLIASVSYPTGPVDSPIRRMMAEPRWFRIDRRDDELWLRPLDIVRLLEARTYEASDSIVIEVIDETRPDVGGRFRLTVGEADGRRTVDRTDDAAELAMGVDVLGAIYLGGINPNSLAVAGRITEHTPGAVDRARAMFVTPTPPFNPTRF